MSGFDELKMGQRRPLDNAAPQHLTHAPNAEDIKRLCCQCAAEGVRACQQPTRPLLRLAKPATLPDVPCLAARAHDVLKFDLRRVLGLGLGWMRRIRSGLFLSNGRLRLGGVRRN